MKKRGTLALKPVVESVVIAVIALFVYLGVKLGTAAIYSEGELAVEHSLIAGVVSGLKHNGYVLYPGDLSDFYFRYLANTVRVSQDADDPLFREASFVTTNSVFYEGTFAFPERLYFGNIGKQLVISEEKPDLRLLPCSDELLGLKLIDKKIVVDTRDPDGFGSMLADVLRVSRVKKLTEIHDTLTPIEIQTILNDGEFIIGFQNRGIANRDVTKAYISHGSLLAKANSHIACKGLNALLTHPSLTSVIEDNNLDPISAVTLIPANDVPLLQKDKLAIVFDVGDNLRVNVDSRRSVVNALQNMMRLEI